MCIYIYIYIYTHTYSSKQWRHPTDLNINAVQFQAAIFITASSYPDTRAFQCHGRDHGLHEPLLASTSCARRAASAGKRQSLQSTPLADQGW